MKDFRDGIGWIVLWLITIVISRKWQSLSNFLGDNGWHKISRGVYERFD